MSYNKVPDFSPLNELNKFEEIGNEITECI